MSLRARGWIRQSPIVRSSSLRASLRSLDLSFHPQCFRSSGHFAGTDEERANAFLEAANDRGIDAVWFARGGYGAGRVTLLALDRLNETAAQKMYLGYSDAGALLAGLYARGFRDVAHGPMPADLNREGGEEAVAASLAYLMTSDPATLEPSVSSDTPDRGVQHHNSFATSSARPCSPTWQAMS